MKKQVLIIVVFFTLVCIFLNGCLEDSNNKKTDSEKELPTSYEDEQFIIWTGTIYQNYSLNINFYEEAVGNMDNVEIKYWAEKREQLAQEALDEIDKFELSQEYEELREEFILFLEDLEKSGFYHAKCASTIIEEGMTEDAIYYGDLGTSYLEKSNEHMNNINNIMKEIID